MVGRGRWSRVQTKWGEHLAGQKVVLKGWIGMSGRKGEFEGDQLEVDH